MKLTRKRIYLKREPWVFQMMILSGFFYLKKDIHMISEVTFLQTDSLLYNED